MCLGGSFGGAVGDTTGSLEEIGVPRNVYGRLCNAAVTSEGYLLVEVLNEATQGRFTADDFKGLVSGSWAMADKRDGEVRTGGKQVPHVFESDSGTRIKPGKPESDGARYMGKVEKRLEKDRQC